MKLVEANYLVGFVARPAVRTVVHPTDRHSRLLRGLLAPLGSPPELRSPAMSHRGWTVDDHLRGRDPAVIRLYDRFVELLRACGPFEVSVAKSGDHVQGITTRFRWSEAEESMARRVLGPTAAAE